MIRQFELVDRVARYDPTVNEDLLNRAYVYATKMHGDQKRASGDPYFSHPIEVAGILTELQLDTATVATGLLHDTLEDTGATYADIDSRFGDEIAQMVEGVTKLSQLDMHPDASTQAENFRKLLLATADDIRVLLVKLADRLHNMRTLHYIKSDDKRRRIAQETMDIYAPLAGRMGMQHFREEYEDLAFAMLHPSAYEQLTARVTELSTQGYDGVTAFADAMAQSLKAAGIEARVFGRKKSPFSIWQKMQRKSIPLEQLSDVFGYRVVTGSTEDCYRALGVLHQTHQYVPGRYKDYISTPKRNGYRSLHTTVIATMKEARQRIEIQIRTEQMDKIAGEGVAAHWCYKDRIDVNVIEPFHWLRDMVAQLKTGASAEEFLENTKLELFADQVFCFTPKGRLIALPSGATVLDFAYAVHTQIGNACVGARVNGKQTGLRAQPRNGDQIEVLCSDTQLPQLGWLDYVRTGKARASIRQAVREKEASDYARLGQKMVNSLFASEKVRGRKNLIERAVGILNCKDSTELYARVGRGESSAAEVLLAARPDAARAKKRRGLSGAMRGSKKQNKAEGALSAVPVDFELQDMAVKFAPNTYPLPGDAIIGIMSAAGGVIVYPQDARRLADYTDQPERRVHMQWATPKKGALYDSRLAITVANKPGVLSRVAQTIADFGANISNLALAQRDTDFYDLKLDIEVQDASHAEQLVAALEGSHVVTAVARVIVDEVANAERIS